ncbi:Hypothetical protein NTJ_15061 [Nesidiocoris tenuis]|uniref:Uncharacterized protein n=1 Tax=Nesidiocoris tenuis TaxID=355587 RepID=A0ABN7BGH9_9HEMI|nr:Hypothetical protein NTJ_15061 [Nesidiocoris tenuis]
MADRRLRLVDDVRTRRRTLRQEARDVRRGIDLVTPSTSPDECDAEQGRVQPKMTRAAANAEKNRREIAERLKEWKKKKEIMTKELRKARPPFNNYVRVKHTGLTPYKGRQARSTQAKQPPPQPNLPGKLKTVRGHPSPRRPATRQAQALTRPAATKVPAMTQNPPVPTRTINYPTGVVNFGLPPHLMVPKAFRPPSNIRPLPLDVVKKGPVTKAAPKISPPTTLKMAQKKPSPPAVSKTVPKVAQTAGQRAAPSAFTGARVLRSIQPTIAQNTVNTSYQEVEMRY